MDERTRELSTLLEVSSHVASTLELRPLLGLILDKLGLVIDHSGSAVHVVDGEWLEMLEYRFPPDNDPGPPRRPAHTSRFWQASLRHGEAVVIADIIDDSPDAAAYRAILGDGLEAALPYVRAYLAAPLVRQDQAIGALVISHHEPGYFTPRRQALVAAIANQAALAIENARLYARARDAAVLEERQRLSRELHDSVSQSIAGMALSARTARTLLNRDPAAAIGPLDALVAESRTALAEMRALIFELRPETLDRDGLVVAIQRQAEAIRARYHLTVEAALCAEPSVSLPAKEALYRIAQEAMHNAGKHARAGAIRVTLNQEDGEAVLMVQDDGRGFDPTAAYPGHLGLHTMRERIARLGGSLRIESAPDAGTCVYAHVPDEA